MIDERLREELRRPPVPEERAAAERSWRVVRAAHDARPPSPRRPRGRRLGAAVVLAAIGLGAALTPAGADVREWVGERIGVHDDAERPVLALLPAPGRLLVAGEAGAWVVQRRGALRRLGDYEEAGWSPRGLHVVGARGRSLTAMDPKGEVRWSLAAPGAVTEPVWSPGLGYRIAYRAGRSLRVVAGDGTGDRLIARNVRPVAPAWRPGRAHVLSYVAARGRVITVDVDSGHRLRVGRTPPGVPRALAWTPDGSRLLIAGERTLAFAGGWVLGVDGLRGMALAPDGKSVALITTRRGFSRVGTLRLSSPKGGVRQLFAGRGRFEDVVWSPDGRRLLLSWREADQWLALPARGKGRVIPYSNIARQFDPGASRPTAFPRVAGWCCAT